MRVILILGFLGAALAGPNHDTRIVGGTDVSIETYPFMANMQYGWAGIVWSQNCGGTLITSLSVLSAAHCFNGHIAAQWRVSLGSAHRNESGSIHNVARFTYHPNYNVLSPLDSDVVIVHLSTAAGLSSTINTAVIASATSVIFAGMPVTTIGWGDLQYQGNRSEQLQQVNINVVDQQTCVQRYAALKTQPGFQNWPDVTENMACAGALNVGGRDACLGDSGGPVIFLGNPNIIVGINSWSYRCADPDHPGVFVRVPSFTNWIVTNASP